MEWSPQDAMKAYLQTLHLCEADTKRIYSGGKEKYGEDGSTTLKNNQQGGGISRIEPQGLELISALAAGNQARVLMEIITSTSQSQGGITPLTISLAVAAKQTGGKLIICIVPSHNLSLRRVKEQLSSYGLDHGVIELRVGDPYEQIRDVRDIDMAVIDCKLDPDRLRTLCESLHLNPKGAMIVANTILPKSQSLALVDQVLKGKRGVKSSVTTLPLGSAGVQVIIRINSVMPQTQRRRHKRFLVTFDG